MTALRQNGSGPRVLVLSTSMLVDRVLLYTRFLEEASRRGHVTVWSTSSGAAENRGLWSGAAAEVEPFPAVRPFKEFPFNHMRRLNDFVWDYRRRPPSRASIARHVRNKTLRPDIRALKAPALGLALLGVEGTFEDALERLLLAYPRSPEASARLAAERPAAVLTTGPFQFEQPGVVAAAKRLGIPTIALIPSWDNISTKNRLVFSYDAYVVWSSRTKEELLDAYPRACLAPVYVVGAPQFDCFFDERFTRSRSEFCASQGLRPELPIVVYALGSPNLLKEHFGAIDMAARVARGELGDVQLLIRPHPLHDNGTFARIAGGFSSRVRVQHPRGVAMALTARSQRFEDVVEWVNTFRHADVVVNLASTVTVDAAIFDRPVVSLDYDPEPGRPNGRLVDDINHVWSHFKPIAESGGVWLTKTAAETVTAIRAYLVRPELHADRRRWIARYVCEHVDGGCAERLAAAVMEFAGGGAAVRQGI